MRSRLMRIKDFNKVAFYTKEDRAVTFADVQKTVARYIPLLSIRKGDRVLIFSENRPEWIYALFSIWYNNGIAVPADYSMPPEDLNYILNNSKPKYIFTSKEGKKTVSKALRGLKNKPSIIVLDSIKPLPKNKKEPVLPDLPDHPADDTAVIIYTSGTTGSPKGVMLSYDNLRANIQSIQEAKMIRYEHTILNLLPFHHILPLQGNILMPFAIGSTTVFVKGLEKELIFEAMQKHKVSMLIAVPRIYELFHNAIMTQIRAKLIARIFFRIAKLVPSMKFRKTIFKKVHNTFGGLINTLVSGGAKLDETVCRNMITLGFNMIEGYGTSETAPMISFTRNGNVKIGSPGQPISTTEAKIENGEIIVRGRNVMQGYYKNPGATKKAIVKGWYHTGDTGRIDRKGFLHVTGRKDELIVLPNGKNINPEDIESSIMGMSPLIKEIGVIQKGGQLVALVAPDLTKLSGKDIVEAFEAIREMVIDKYNKTVANYKKIFKIKLVAADFPRTRLGKLKRFLLKDMLTEEKKNPVPEKEPTFKEYLLLKEFLTNLKQEDIFHYTHLEYDAALDSLDKVELQAYIDRTFGITLEAADLTKAPTLGKLAALVKKQKTKIDTTEANWHDILKEKIDYTVPVKPSRFPHRFLMRRFFKKRFELTVTGLEHLPEGPFILAPNHESYLDALILTSILPDNILFDTFFWVKDSRYMSKVVKLLSGGRNTILINIEKDLKGTLQKSAKILQAGKNLLIFPEGTRTITGELGTFKKAFAILSKELKTPIVPVAIEGAHEAMPRGSKFPKHGKISIDVMKPVKPGKLDYDTLTLKIRQMIEKSLNNKKAR